MSRNRLAGYFAAIEESAEPSRFVVFENTEKHERSKLGLPFSIHRGYIGSDEVRMGTFVGAFTNRHRAQVVADAMNLAGVTPEDLRDPTDFTL